VLGDRRRQLAGQHGVDLDGGHCPRDRQQSEGQRAEARSDLDDHVVGGDSCRSHDAPHGVGVDHEVLPEHLGRSKTQPYRDRAYLGGTEQRCLVVR